MQQGADAPTFYAGGVIMKYLCILIGSGTGGLARYLLSRGVCSLSPDFFPFGTLAVNLTGCFLIGLLSAFFERWIISPELRLFIFTGFLGGFTTFSTFCLESFHLLKGREIRLALLNLLASNLLGLGMVLAGYITVQMIIKLHK